VTRWKVEYLPAYLSNGLIGIRAGTIPLVEGLCIVNGLAGIQSDALIEGFARGPYPLAGDIELDEHRLSRLPGQARFIEQRYDFACGELHSRFEFQGGGTTATVEVLTFCSRSLPTTVLQEVRVHLDRPARLTMSAGLDPSGIPGRWLSRETEMVGGAKPVVDGCMRWETHGGLSTCGAAYTTKFEGGDGVQRQVAHDELAPMSTSYAVDALPGPSYVLRQIAGLVPSQMHNAPERQATRMAALATARGFDVIRRENRRAWEELWRGRIVLMGADPRWQGMADAAFYYLHASAHEASLSSTAMFGLAYWPNYHYYWGHVMWDIETFAFPALLLTDPEAARALLAYRFERARGAEQNAAMNGYRGLQFPWASSPRHGDETNRIDAPLIIFEQHVNMSVANAFAQFVHATGDQDFLREQAWPIIRGVANWLGSRVCESERGVEIRETVGIAEENGPVDNNAYVNMAAAVVLREAAAFARQLDRPGAAEWDRMARRMFVPMDEARQVIYNHEHFDPRDKGTAAATPEALGGFFPFSYEVDEALERATITFALDRVDPYIGRPMLNAPLGVYAAWLGDRHRSAQLFEAGYADYVMEPFRETSEFSLKKFPDKPRAGPMFANLGGFLTSCLYGLPGLRLDSGPPSGWCRRPVVMPESWEGIEVERLWVRGRPAHLYARQGMERARLEVDVKPG
jgi:trehalose/maltose hydrolase-like predicted phosphorylase